MTGTEAIHAIESWHGSGSEDLSSVRSLLCRMGNPQNRLRFIHVAGSNGKGSTCAMLSSILLQAGYRVGLFTSPYIEDFRERIQVNGRMISQDSLAEITQGVLALSLDLPNLRQFALITAIAMEYFCRCNCDIVVLEVGLGGIVDATNVIDTPEVAVITNIGLEHTDRLGHTLPEIAQKKAGIIKSGCDVISYHGAQEVNTVISRQCESVGATLHICDFTQLTAAAPKLSGQDFCYRGKNYTLSLLGQHQLHNAAVVLETVDALRRKGWHIPVQCVQAGLSRVSWPARFEILSRDPLFILDGGHNPQCAAALSDTLTRHSIGPICCIVGIMGDKDIPAMIRQMLPHTAHFLCVSPNDPRAIPAQELASLIHTVPATACLSVADALSRARRSDLPVVAFGSLYLAGEIRSIFFK